MQLALFGYECGTCHEFVDSDWNWRNDGLLHLWTFYVTNYPEA